MPEFIDDLVKRIDKRIEKIDFELATTYDNAIPFLPEYEIMYNEFKILRKTSKKLHKIIKKREKMKMKEKKR